jgi:tetratricopeptide (TPR) repeat protein
LRISAPELFSALREPAEGALTPVFSPLGETRFALGLETIYEGYLVHYGTPRLYEPQDGDAALVLGDYLYAQGLARIASLGDVAPVTDLAELISLCAQARADGRPGDGPAWAATAALLGRGRLDEARAALSLRGDAAPLDELARGVAGDDAVEQALAAHARRLG